jgi:hypothetical protein
MGRVFFAGGKIGMESPSTGILAGELAVGSSVFLMENGSPVEYLIVNQGIPNNSSLYDNSCDGMWLLRKDVYENRRWHSSGNNNYQSSEIHAYLNSDFFALFDSNVQTLIREVKIPYRVGSSGSTVSSGAGGLSAKIFLLSLYEVGVVKTSTYPYRSIDGDYLEYFSGVSETNSKRIAYYEGSLGTWWLRSPRTKDAYYAYMVYDSDGKTGAAGLTNLYGIRPALILPSNALFDEDTLLLKGVS